MKAAKKLESWATRAVSKDSRTTLLQRAAFLRILCFPLLLFLFYYVLFFPLRAIESHFHSSIRSPTRRLPEISDQPDIIKNEVRDRNSRGHPDHPTLAIYPLLNQHETKPFTPWTTPRYETYIEVIFLLQIF